MDDTHTLARATDPDTSHEAAAEQTPPKRAALQGLIVDILRSNGPLTHDDIAGVLRAGPRLWGPTTPSGVRSRVSELRDQGVVVADARRGTSATGRPATRWRLATPADEITVRVRPAGGAHDHEAGMAAARRLAAWEYGDPEVAGAVLDAYLRPAEAHATLDDDGAP